MSSSNTGRLSGFLRWCRCIVCSSSAVAAGNAETDWHHVATLVKAFKAGTVLDASYDPILKAVMKNGRSRDALITAVMDNMKLSQSMITDFPNAAEITNDHVEAAAQASFAIDTQLIPPHGTRGFNHLTYKVEGTNWSVDVYAYRHANPQDVTLIVLHSGSTSARTTSARTTFTVVTTPEAARKFHYPETYDNKDQAGRYLYQIDYTDSINMMGTDGKNATVFKAHYKENFIAKSIIKVDSESSHVKFSQDKGPIHGMSFFSVQVATSKAITIKLEQDVPTNPGHNPKVSTGKVEFKV